MDELRKLAADRDQRIREAEEADQRLATWADWYERHVVYDWYDLIVTGDNRETQTG